MMLNNDKMIMIEQFSGVLKNGNRNILIIGAGASNDVANLPLGKELAQKLIESLGFSSGSKSKLFNKHLYHLEKTFGFAQDDFKTILFALNKMDNESLLDKFLESLVVSSIHSNTYSIIADLLEKGVLHTIINFNFDEILDQEISKIYDRGNLNKIVCDKDVSYESFQKVTGFRYYIKPHGTIGFPDTLRFRRSDYYRIEKKVAELIHKIFSDTDVNIIVVGFRLKFYEFSSLINSSISNNSRILIIDKTDDILDPNLDRFYANDYLKIDEKLSLSYCFESIRKSMISVELTHSIEEPSYEVMDERR
ncbi:MAG: SIR2 family protein [Flavobacteriaceae bacterium]|nr:SIR2 family protein [Flavobacteriaceae bacterium]